MDDEFGNIVEEAPRREYDYDSRFKDSEEFVYGPV